MRKRLPITISLRKKHTDPHSKRQARLRAWLAYHGIENRELAELLGVHPSMITKIIKGDRAPGSLIEKLVTLGVPRAHLPRPSERGPGRPPKKRN